ncbi:MAG: DUF1223 domain-containing protein [Pseudomonadota bacterium]
MRRIWTIICASSMALSATLAGSAWAQNTTVIELYTSQGCSSCPPADKMLHDLAKDSDVIALAFHVDYWDYIGWKDEFADPSFTERQKAYARAAGARSVYTPQMIIGGQDHVIGTRPQEVSAHLANHGALEPKIDVETSLSGNRVQVRAEALERLPSGIEVQIVTYRPTSTVAIKRGENAGRTLDYTNVVTSLTQADTWNGRGDFSMQASLPGTDRAVVLFQAPDSGAILGAAHLR